jgi:hypothetical protein
LVEQRTENPCVPGSIPGGTTIKSLNNFLIIQAFLLFIPESLAGLACQSPNFMQINQNYFCFPSANPLFYCKLSRF